MNRDKLYFKHPRGQSLVELAVGAVVLLILLGAVVDAGRMFFTFIALRDAAQEGTTFASYNPTDTAGIQQRVRASSTRPIDLTDASAVTVSVPVQGTCVGQAVTVRVRMNSFEMIMPFTSVIANHIPITAEVTDTILTPSCP